MNTSHPVYDEVSELPKVLEFLNLSLKLVVAWLKKAIEIQEYSEYLLQQDTDLFLIDRKVALYFCAYEIMGILQRLFVGDHRCIRFYILYDFNQETPHGENKLVTIN